LPPLTPTTPITPSPLFADIVLANEEFPLILATEKHNLTVTQRKLELVAVEALEIALQQSATGNHQDAYRTLEEVRPFLRGTFEAAVLGPEDREAAQFHTIQQSIDVLDDTLGVVANSVRQSAAFDSEEVLKHYYHSLASVSLRRFPYHSPVFFCRRAWREYNW
jgi:hypothetical protein